MEDPLQQPTDTSLIHRKVVLADVLRLKPHEDQVAGTSFSSNHERRRGSRLVLRFGNPLVRLCCVRVLGVVVRVLADDEERGAIVLWIDDSTGLIEVEYPAINLTYLPKRPEVGDLYDFLGEIFADENGTRFINAYGMDYKKDGNWEALRYLEIVDMYTNHYYKDTYQRSSRSAGLAILEEEEQQDEDQRREYEQMSQGSAVRNPRSASTSVSSTSSPSFRSSVFSQPTPTTTDTSATDGAAIEAMLQQKGSATLEEIARSFPRCNNLVSILENLMLDGVLYEKDGRYHPL